MKPNIFELATKELNQDAFITWLLQFADANCIKYDEYINKCGIEFVTELIKKQIPEFDEKIETVKAGRQWENIDVWAEINDKYLIIIEDKTNTSHHSDQLGRYKKSASEWCLKNNYKEPICIYLKTGNEAQSSLDDIVKQGFAIFNRKHFIDLLIKYNETDNDIFKDFYNRLVRIEKSHNEYEDKKIGEWKSADWEGFYQFLEKEINLVSWNFVNNPNGGFWNAVLNWNYWGIYPSYLQIEQGNLCFKISTDPDELEMPENITRSEIRDKLHNLIIKKGKEFGIKGIKRPDRFGHGKYMTVAIVEKKNWLGNNDETLNKEKVSETLKSYRKFLKEIIK